MKYFGRFVALMLCVALSVVLHPGFKLEWYKMAQWPKEWVKNYRKLVVDEWTVKYKSALNAQPESEPSGSGADFFQKLYKSQMGNNAKDSSDELTKFLKEPVVSSNHLKAAGMLGWWKVSGSEVIEEVEVSQ